MVRGFAGSELSADAWLEPMQHDATHYGPFNLLLWDGASLAFASNHPAGTHRNVAPGVHAMSNGAFDAPWPKSMHATQALSEWLESSPAEADQADVAPLLAALADTTSGPDAALPDTGVGLELERKLSPPFVRDGRYGTRCSTVVLVGVEGIRFVERRFGPDGGATGDSDAWLDTIMAK